MVAQDFPNVRLIKNDKNKGFGAANNQGLDAMTGDLALLLNSDAAATPGAIQTLKEAMTDGTVACGGMLLGPNGEVQESAANQLTLWAVFCEQTLLEKAFPRSEAFSPYWVSKRLLETGTTPAEVAQVMGACLLMRPVERFDERFFLYCEDTELCKRLRRHGRILYVPQAVFKHELGSSSAQRWQAVARYNRGKELYFEIHHTKAHALLCLLFDRTGALLRLFAWLLASAVSLCTWSSARKKVALFARVFVAPITGPSLPPDADPKSAKIPV
jgi:GT2 family glycosyltransferase